jgi:hypothetical protein
MSDPFFQLRMSVARDSFRHLRIASGISGSIRGEL